jgi:hypothetical protein
MIRLQNPWFLVILLCIAQFSASGSVTFNWPSSPGWTAGTPTAGQTKTQSFTSVNPNDITVSINNSGAGPLGMTYQSGYPQINSTNTTGGFSGVNGLQLYVSSSQALSTYTRTTVSFATPVINLSFQIWDVDANSGQFVDKIANIQAVPQGGGLAGADSVTSAVSGYNSITGTGLATVVLGTANANNSTNQGTINIIFNGPITQFSFDWSNNDSGLGQQAVGLGPLTYTPVPETTPPWSAVGAAATVIGFELLRHQRSKTSR